MVKKTLNRKEFLKTTMAGMAGIEPSFKEAVKWVLQHKFISSAAIQYRIG